jgi:two-component system cell cycle response regulator CpdR
MGGDEPRNSAAHLPSSAGAEHVVLVVDDEPVVREFIGRALTAAGFHATLAGDGREALRLVVGGTVRPHVLLTDIEMPGMSGIELAARLLAIRPTVRVVMMTGDPSRAAAARDRTSIVATVLMKPLETRELVAAVGPDRTTISS